VKRDLQMKDVVILIHGYNTRDPQRTVGKLSEPFRRGGLEVHEFNYGFTSLFQVRIRNFALAKKLGRVVKKYQGEGRRVVIVGHSNGCTIIHLAHKLFRMRADCVIAINPALSRKTHPPLLRCAYLCIS